MLGTTFIFLAEQNKNTMTDRETNITVSGLNGIADSGSGVASIKVLHNTSDSAAGATESAVAVGTDRFVITGLTPATAYYIWTKATDNAGNTTDPVPVATVGGLVWTRDETAPTGLGSVAAALGPDPKTQIVLSNLGAVTDNVGVTSFKILYSATNDSAGAMEANAGPEALGAGSYTLSELTPGTKYYLWTTAADAAGNTVPPTPVAGGGSVTTEAAGPSLVPPSSYSTKTVYSYTGANQDIAVAGGKVLRAKLWGAGGRGRYGNAPGAAGGYTEAVIKLPSDATSVRVVVGSAGQSGPGTSSVYGGGGGLGTDNGYGGAGGGGRSAIQILVGGVYKDILTAGGGGGGGEKNGGQYGGAGGGLIGMTAFNSSDSAGTQTRGGTCVNQAGAGNTAGSQYTGGWATTGFTGGSGGGGYYGGAGAGGPGGYEHRGGGGGSGFVGLDGTVALSGVEWGSAAAYADDGTTRADSSSGVWYTRTKCLRGSGTVTVMKTDPDYATSGDVGQHGRVVLEIA